MSAAAAKIAQELSVDVIAESALWNELPDAEAVVRDAIAQAADALGSGAASGEIAVLLTDDAAMRCLNATWRGLDKPTNVLSFPAAVTPGSRHLGDIAIAFETAKREAQAEHKPIAHHLAHLAVHGFLHLLGYDHESEPDAETMEQLERAILARIGVPDPYQTLETGA
jgi:probable rRNA maturation factor